jgi:hypothetical protein
MYKLINLKNTIQTFTCVSYLAFAEMNFSDISFYLSFLRTTFSSDFVLLIRIMKSVSLCTVVKLSKFLLTVIYFFT